MNRLFYVGLPALLLSVAVVDVAPIARANAAEVIKSEIILASAPTVRPTIRSSAGTFEVNTPTIVGSGVRGTNHFIRVAVMGMSLEDLMISLPAQMERFEAVQIRDQSGKTVAAKTTVLDDRIVITFDQPVVPDTTLEVLLTGVRMEPGGGNTLLYGVTAERVGTTGEIPVGTARVQVPSRS